MSSWNYSYLAKAVYRFALLICLFEKNPPLPVAMFPLSGCASILSVGVILRTGMVTSAEWHCSANCPPQAPAHRQCPRVSPSPGHCPGASKPRPLHLPPLSLPPAAPCSWPARRTNGLSLSPLCLLPRNLFPRFEAPRLQPCPGAWSRRISMACLPFMRGKRSCLQNIKWLGRCGEAELLICQHLLLLRSWHRLPSPLSPFRPPPT